MFPLYIPLFWFGSGLGLGLGRFAYSLLLLLLERFLVLLHCLVAHIFQTILDIIACKTRMLDALLVCLLHSLVPYFESIWLLTHFVSVVLKILITPFLRYLIHNCLDLVFSVDNSIHHIVLHNHCSYIILLLFAVHLYRDLILLDRL